MASIDGVTKINNVNSQCTVRLYDRLTGELIRSQYSNDLTGNYSFGELPYDSTEYDIMCIGDSSVCPQISGPITSDLSAGRPSNAWMVNLVDSSAAASKTLNFPAETAIDDLIIVFVFIRGDMDTPDGWTKEFETPTMDLDGRLICYSKLSDATGLGQSFTAEYSSGSGGIDITAYGFTWTGSTPPYIAKLSYDAKDTNGGTPFSFDIGLLESFGIPIFASAYEYRQTTGITGSTVTCDVNGDGFTMSGWIIDGADGSDSNTSRITSRCSPISFSPSDEITNIVQFGDVSTEVQAACVFIITCGEL